MRYRDGPIDPALAFLLWGASDTSAEQITIEFTSVPSDAEIEIDGNYARNTPSNEMLRPA